MNYIEENCRVLLYLDNRRNYLIKVEKDKKFHTHKGFIQLNDLIGKEYGTKIRSSTDTEFIAFKPIIRDYVFKSLRKTQIIYPKDVAIIILFSGIGPGSKVVEAGTGTGALACALSYYVKPNGHVYSYEIREPFINAALKNLQAAGTSEYIDIKNKDITQGIDEKDLDAVILDLATPWIVVSEAYNALKGSGSFASFSPTIDQVVKTVESLTEQNFVNVETVEFLMRRMQVERGKTRPETLMTGHTGYMTFARKAIK